LIEIRQRRFCHFTFARHDPVTLSSDRVNRSEIAQFTLNVTAFGHMLGIITRRFRPSFPDFNIAVFDNWSVARVYPNAFPSSQTSSPVDPRKNQPILINLAGFHFNQYVVQLFNSVILPLRRSLFERLPGW
jgi:hypothetical protein